MAKHKKIERIKITKIPTYTEVKQMVEALMKRTLLEPVQETQSGDIIVFQNGVLDLKELNPQIAFKEAPDAPVRYSHGLWSYFQPVMWESMVDCGMHLIHEEEPGDGFKKFRNVCELYCPVFTKYMDEWFPGDMAALEIVLRWFGYCMTTDTGENKFMFFYGPTRAGKGSLARLLCGLIGDTNYSSTNYSAFEDKFQAIGMHDRLVVSMEEVEATPKQHEVRLGMLKKYLGGERITWEQKYQRGFEDRFIGKIIMQANEVLAYEDKGRSVTARMLPMEFRESFFGSGEEAPERNIFNNGEGRAIATIAAMAWYKMKRNKIRGAFDFKKQESWSVDNCKACSRGNVTLLLESHKIAFRFLMYKPEVFLGEKKFKKLKSEGKLIRCTRDSLKEITELLLEHTGKTKEILGLSKILCEAVRREYPECEEKQFKINDIGRKRGWTNLYINMKEMKKEFPEVFDNTEEYGSSGVNLLG